MSLPPVPNVIILILFEKWEIFQYLVYGRGIDILHILIIESANPVVIINKISRILCHGISEVFQNEKD